MRGGLLGGFWERSFWELKRNTNKEVISSGFSAVACEHAMSGAAAAILRLWEVESKDRKAWVLDKVVELQDEPAPGQPAYVPFGVWDKLTLFFKLFLIVKMTAIYLFKFLVILLKNTRDVDL